MKSLIRPGKLVWPGLLAAGLLLLTGCSEGAGSREEMIEVLAREDGFSQVEAECIAGAIFDEYGENDDDLRKLSAQSYEQLESEEGVPGFDNFLAEAVSDCTAVGPTLDD